MSTPRNRRLFLLALPLVLQACVRAPVHELSWPHPIHGRPVLLRVDASDGIDKGEARTISILYVLINYDYCGANDEPSRRGNQWFVTPRFGDPGIPSEKEIVIDARTGAVSYPGWPSFETSGDLLADPRVWDLVSGLPESF